MKLSSFFSVVFLLLAVSLVFSAPGDGIIPSPQKCVFKEGYFNLDHATIKTENEIAKYIELLKTELERRNPGISIGASKNASIVMILGDGPKPEKDFQVDEAYSLQVTPHRITIRSSTGKGLFYGAVTLINMSEKGRVQCAEIIDYPAMKFRGLHLNLRDPNRDRNMSDMKEFIPECYYGKSIMYSLEWLKEFTRKCALLKYNYIVFECDDKVQWSATEGKYNEGALSREQVEQWVEYAGGYNVEIIPMVNAPGHAHWYTSHNKPGYGGWTNDALEGYRVDVSDPKVVADFKSIMEEECEWFKGEYVHIAADETEKAEEFIQGLVDVAKKHGRKIIAWDGPAAVFAEKMGFINMPWHYGYGYRSMKADEICAGGIWSNGQWQGIMGHSDQSFNVFGWAREVLKSGSTGMLTTAWINYPGPSYNGLWEQIVISAQASWYAKDRPSDYNLRFARQFFGNPDPSIYEAHQILYTMKSAGQRNLFYLRAADLAVDTLWRNGGRSFDAERNLYLAQALQAAVDNIDVRRNKIEFSYLEWYGKFMEFNARSVLAARGDRENHVAVMKMLAPEILAGFRDIWGYGMTDTFVLDSWGKVVESRIEELGSGK